MVLWVRKIFTKPNICEPNDLIIDKTREFLNKLKTHLQLLFCISSENKVGFLIILKLKWVIINKRTCSSDPKKLEINVRKLDDILDSHKIRADVIKLDLQGY